TVFVVKQRCCWWPSLVKDVAEYVAACSVCARSKALRQALIGLLQPLQVPHRPWSDISLDFVTGLPPSKHNTGPPVHIWVLEGVLTAPLRHHQPVIRLPPGAQRPERLNQELETCLRCLMVQNQMAWSNHLTWVEYAHNSLPTAATGLSPFQVVHGYQPPLFPVNEEDVTVPSAHAL
ncbi:hypothetical protein L3Q82_014074, partial [Scortum barcoo]